MIGKLNKITVPLLLFLLSMFFCVNAPGFASWQNLFNLLRQVAILGIVSTGLSFVLVAGQVDLSVGSLLSFVSCVVAILITKVGIAPALAYLLGIIISAAASALHGAIIRLTGMPAMLCTLAAMQVYQGLAYIVTSATPVYGLPDSIRILGQGYFGIVPVPVLIMIAVFLVGWYIFNRTVPGRQFYAIGGNAEASRLAGVSVTKTTVSAFFLCGVSVGIASCVQMSRLFGGFPTAGSGLEMEAITAAVVGGVSFSGGKGNIPGVVLGVLLMGVLSNGLGIMGVNTFTQMVFKGVVLAVVVGIDCWQQKNVQFTK